MNRQMFSDLSVKIRRTRGVREQKTGELRRTKGAREMGRSEWRT